MKTRMSADLLGCDMRVFCKAYRAQLFVSGIAVLAIGAMLILSGLWWVLLMSGGFALVLTAITLIAWGASSTEKNHWLARLWRATGGDVFVYSYHTIYYGREVDAEEQQYIDSLSEWQVATYRRRSDRFRIAAGKNPRFYS